METSWQKGKSCVDQEPEQPSLGADFFLLMHLRKKSEFQAWRGRDRRGRTPYMEKTKLKWREREGQEQKRKFPSQLLLPSSPHPGPRAPGQGRSSNIPSSGGGCTGPSCPRLILHLNYSREEKENSPFPSEKPVQRLPRKIVKSNIVINPTSGSSFISKNCNSLNGYICNTECIK